MKAGLCSTRWPYPVERRAGHTSEQQRAAGMPHGLLAIASTTDSGPRNTRVTGQSRMVHSPNSARYRQAARDELFSLDITNECGYDSPGCRSTTCRRPILDAPQVHRNELWPKMVADKFRVFTRQFKGCSICSTTPHQNERNGNADQRNHAYPPSPRLYRM